MTLKQKWVCICLILLQWECAYAQERLVVAGGSLTEIVYALEAQSQLVGVDASSVYPAQTRSLPNVGYYRTLNVEGVLSVSPNKLLLLKGAGPQKALNQLSELGIASVMVDNPKTVEGLFNMIRVVAVETGTKEKGDRLIATVKEQLSGVLNKPPLNHKSAVFLMSAGERGLVAAGQNTTPQLIFDTLNIQNPFSDLSGYKPVSSEALAQNPPDIILVASHTSGEQSAEDLCATNQLKLWSALNGCNLVKVDSLKFLGLTPRLPQAITETYNLF